MATLSDTAPTCNLIAHYATFHAEPGYAIRTADHRVFFVDHDAQCTPLSNADIPALVLLGSVNIAERQHLLDAFHGGAAALCTSRKQGVA